MIPGMVHVGYVHPGVVTEQFCMSLLMASKFSERIFGVSAAQSPRQFVARNENIKNFLRGQAEWFL